MELERKLKPYEQAPGLLAKALDELQAKGLINEERVVESLVYRRSAKFGAARIKQELQRKGLDPGVVLATVAALQATEFERAGEVWRKKFGAYLRDSGAPEAPSAAERGRQMRFLAARGFSTEVIRRVIAGISEDQDQFLD